MNSTYFSRRTFLMGSALAASASVFSSRKAFAEDHGAGGPSPNEKLNIAGIGIGGQGHEDLKNCEAHNIVALCDVDSVYATRTFKRYPEAKQYTDFRVMLEKQKDIDAVVIATPDHTHAIAAMTALQMGKHVYCEKPLTYSIAEARKLAAAAREAKVATQMGNNGQARDEVRVACEYIWSGAIGPVREVHVWTDRPIWPQGIDRPKEEHARRDSLDWDLWLGPAPERPFNLAYHPFKWRGWWDFGTGALGDIACHAFPPIFRALKLEHPLSVEACSSDKDRKAKETYPLASVVRYRFPERDDMPPLELTWYDGGLRPACPAELGEGKALGSGGTLYIGDKGKMLGHVPIPESRQNDLATPPQMLPRSPGHFEEWFLACKGGDAAGSNFDFAGLVTQVVLLGNISLRTGRPLCWDGNEITNDSEANQFLGREARPGWDV